MKTLSREEIQRMVGRSNSRRNVAGNNQESSSQGFATPSWVDENYLSKSFFSTLFIIHATQTVTVTDDQGQPVGEPTVTEITLAPNLLPGTTSVTDSTTGYTTTTVIAITSIEATKNFYSGGGVSALGQSSGGGGGGATALTDLVDVAISNPSNGQVLKYNSTTNKWENANESGGGGTGTVTSITAGTGLSGGTITTSGTIAINSTYQSYISHGETAYGWGNHANAGYLTSVSFSDLTSHPTTLSGYGITDAKIQNGTITLGSNTITPLTSVSFSDLTTHPTTLSGYGITDAKFGTANNDKRPITLGSVTQDVLIAHQSLAGYATESWVTGTALSGYATQQWVGQQGFLTSVAFSDLTTHPTTLSGYGITDAYTKTEADGRFLTISFFRSLFRAYNSSSVEVVPNSGDTTTIDNIKAMFGFWTEQYLSALGQSSGGGGGSIQNLTITGTLTLGHTVIADKSPSIVRQEYDSDCLYLFNGYTNSKINSQEYYYNQYDNVGLLGKDYTYSDTTWWIDPDGCALFHRVYLSNNVYLYTDGSNIKVRIGSTVYTLTKS